MAPPYQSDDFDENSISGSTDVKLTNLANAEVLAWNATTSKWENATNGGGGVAQNLQQVLTQGNDGGSLNVRNPGSIGNTGSGALRLYTNNDTTDAASTVINGVQKKVQSSTLRSLNNTGFDAPNGTDTAGFYKIALRRGFP